jgi:hypothetical protein
MREGNEQAAAQLIGQQRPGPMIWV